MKKVMLLLFFSAVFAANCGGGMYAIQGGGKEDLSYSTPWGNVTITKDAFILGSDYPSDIVIPEIDGMSDTAFVVSFSSPTGVLAIDLESDPLAVSTKFKGLISPNGTGFPGNLYIMNSERAFLLTSSHVIDFNPRTGGINTAVKIIEKLALGEYLPMSDEYDVDGDGTLDRSRNVIDLSYPSDLIAIDRNLYISFSNFISPILPAVAAPGVVKRYKILDTPPYLKETAYLITTDYNPVGLTKISDTSIAVTNGGVTDLWEGAAHPLTDASIDIVDMQGFAIIRNIPMGLSAPSFGKMALTSDGKTAFIGSRSYGEVYAIDLLKNKLIYGHENPLTLTTNDEGGDYISSCSLSYDDWYLFSASFDTSSIYPVDIKAAPPSVLPSAFSKPFVLGFPKGVTKDNPTGTNTGIGKIAVRPGIPGIDYTGADIFAITGNPGTIVTINTHGTKKGNTLQIKKMEIVPNEIKLNENSNTTQLHLNIEFENGTLVSGITDIFTNPYSGYPSMVRWESSNAGVASVNAGLVTINSTGEAVIIARIGQMGAGAHLIIEPSEVPDTSDEETETPEDENPNYNFHYLPDIFSWKIPKVHLYINPAIFGYRHVDEPDEPVKPEILTDAPAGTDPFADKVVSFQPGPGAGFGAGSMPGIVLGPPRGTGHMSGSTHVVSLGYKGEIILEMTDFIIADGAGPDFTVFENVFYAGGNPDNPWSEPGIVGVSEDGKNFIYFNCDINDKPHYRGCAGTKPTYSNPSNGIDPTDPSTSGGNQFDLKDVGLKTARFVKITDVGVSGSGGTTAGFDLDAVTVINGVVLK